MEISENISQESISETQLRNFAGSHARQCLQALKIFSHVGEVGREKKIFSVFLS